jgi:hypothetical protein
MSGMLPPEVSFAQLRAILIEAGWHEQPVRGSWPPLLAGEPESARFEKEGEVLLYSFNPAVRLRLIEGAAVPARLQPLERAEVAALLLHEDPEVVLRAMFAAAALGWDELRPDVSAAAARLPTGLAAFGQGAVERLRPPSGASTSSAPSALPVGVQRRLLRAALVDPPQDAARLVEVALRGGDPELAATAAIGAARLGLTRLREAVARADLAIPGTTRHKRALLRAIQALCVETLAGGRPGGGPGSRDRLWRIILGTQGPVSEPDAAVLLVAALSDPIPEPVDGCRPGFRKVPAVPHWLGDAERGGLANPIRRWRPPVAFCIAAAPLPDRVPAGAAADRIAREVEGGAVGARLPHADEWEAALRGPDGRARPWGESRWPVAGSEASPWGVTMGPPRVGEWVSQGDRLVIVAAERSGVVACRQAPAAGMTALVRLVSEEPVY